MSTQDRTIVENRNEEADLTTREAIVRAEQELLGDRKVIPPYFPRDLPAGDPMSEGGTKVTWDELDDDLKALIGGAGAGPALPFTEWDITPGGAIAAGDVFNITAGTFAVAGARTTVVADVGTPMFPSTGAAFQNDSRIDIWLDGQHLSLGPGAGTPRDVYWVASDQIAFATNLRAGQTIRVRAPASY
jgi:hypothetical protein